MGKPKRKYVRKQKPQEGSYSLSLKLGDETYESSAESIAKALSLLPRPRKITTKGELTLKGDGRVFKRSFFPMELKRFLWPVANDINAKIIGAVFK